MRILVGCEYSAIVRDAFRRRGHDAWSCDFLPCEGDPAWHYQEDVRLALRRQPWDLFIVHPECTYLCVSGLHWNGRVPGRAEKTEESLLFVKEMMFWGVPSLALENPIGCISTRIREADQIIQPYNFGEDASKATCLWLTNLPKLTPTEHIPGRIVGYRKNGKPVERWANQTDSGQNRLTPSATRWKDRSRTYSGIAEAMASQWGCLG